MPLCSWETASTTSFKGKQKKQTTKRSKFSCSLYPGELHEDSSLKQVTQVYSLGLLDMLRLGINIASSFQSRGNWGSGVSPPCSTIKHWHISCFGAKTHKWEISLLVNFKMGVQQNRHCFYSCVAAFSRSAFLLLPLSVCVLDQFPVWSSKGRFEAQAWHNKVKV